MDVCTAALEARGGPPSSGGAEVQLRGLPVVEQHWNPVSFSCITIVWIGVCKSTLSFGDLLEGLRGLRSSYQFWFSTAQGHKAESAQSRDLGCVWGNLETPLQARPHGTHFTPPAPDWMHVWNVVYQGRSLETQSPRVLFGTGHIGTLYLTQAQIPDS